MLLNQSKCLLALFLHIFHSDFTRKEKKKNQGCLPGFIVLVILRSFYIEKKNLSKQVQQLPCISPSDH